MSLIQIEPMTRVSLEMEAGRSADAMDLTERLERCEFIYGLGTGGLTGFEYALSGKQPGDAIQLHIRSADMHLFFGHIRLPVLRHAVDRPEIFLTARIKDIQRADSREVVKALADAAECGCSCCGHKAFEPENDEHPEKGSLD